ncbi:MAG: hypothetical protein ABR577_20190, partial [Pyrinomonadaceae bacterium]
VVRRRSMKRGAENDYVTDTFDSKHGVRRLEPVSFFLGYQLGSLVQLGCNSYRSCGCWLLGTKAFQS